MHKITFNILCFIYILHIAVFERKRRIKILKIYAVTLHHIDIEYFLLYLSN